MSVRRNGSAFAGHDGRRRNFSAPDMGRAAHGEVVTSTWDQAARTWSAALRAADRHRRSADPAVVAASLLTSLPPHVVVALHRFRIQGSPNNALLLRGICPVLTDLPATPATVTPRTTTRTVEAAALLLLALTLPLGEPFTFRSLHEGRLVQHVVPVPGREGTQTGVGSTAALDWHVEDGFTDDRCDHFGLLCLRGHPGVFTVLSPARRLDLDPADLATLRAPRYLVAPDDAHVGARIGEQTPAPVLTGPPEDPEICFGEGDVRPADPADRRAAAALRALTTALDHGAIGHELRPGDVLIADNRRIVHGRTTFRPRYDGADRWLLRAMTCASIRAHRRRGARRALG
ncbi:TauD/TfdA family dioxygenase [Nocardia sp. alder85J]|uniref:TauD/TfdA family dioxygenase n=1 Tax=Nocardia sp. alder85J TaxID=2862949 RepID=UPI001CD3E575|nr:TauD/TfdA family dioxygenase [Nocardia sp. alder85J]MCX4093385.1 TauD/TfdA family dioxygenase [Nocardia sp. alder85J]